MTIILIPGSYLTPQQKATIKFNAAAAIRARCANLNSTQPDQIDVRETVCGNAGTDFVDFYQATAVTAGDEEWSQDSGDLTAGDLSNWVIANTTEGQGQPKKGTVLGCYGLADISGVADLTMVAYDISASRVAVIEVESMYVTAAGQIPEGFFFDDITREMVVIMWEPGQTIKIYQNHKAAADRQVIHYMLTGELQGTYIDKGTPSPSGIQNVRKLGTAVGR